MYKRHIFVGGLGVFSVFVSMCLAQLPEVPDDAVEALGVTTGTPKRNGFVFIEGRYIIPPYTVSRKGNGIFINRIQVEQPIAWNAETLKPVLNPQPKKAEPPKKTAPEKEKPSLFDTTAESPALTAVPDSIIISNETPAVAQVGKTLDALFDEPATNAPAGNEKNVAGSDKKAAPVVLTQKQKDEIRQKLDMIRARFELGLAQGEIYFFNHKYGRVNGTYGTAKALFAVLPEALRYSQSPQDLMARLRQGGVSFLDINTCTDLYRHKLNFTVISDRRRQIELYDATKQLKP
jgi:hypothetical protein